ncbi:MAG: AzlD domain-containing protein [Clostridia bacterium]|nr:AzlD domain-containing protein [Clostridia bacterium]
MIYAYIAVMAITTYLVRALPLTIFRGKITNKYIRSFLKYVPCACLSAMIFPSILFATNHIISGAVGLLVAILFALRNKSLVIVAASSCVAVYVTELLMTLI